MTDNKPLVSVCTITYNHADYIRKCIDSVLAQEHDFKIEMIIGEDCSTDETGKIVQDYAQKYPDIIRIVTSENNVGAQPNALRTFSAAKGKYIALIEGDDEWTDTQKLAKQVKILESKPEIVMCYTGCAINDMHNPDSSSYFKEQKPAKILTGAEMLNKTVVPTCTVMYRNVIKPYPEWFKDVYGGAHFLFYLLGKYGDMYYHDEVTALYNHHYKGMSRAIKRVEVEYNDSKYMYKIIEHYDNDPDIFKAVIERNLFSMNAMVLANEIGKARDIYNSLPLRKLLNYKEYRMHVINFFVKTYLPFLRNKKKNNK